MDAVTQGIGAAVALVERRLGLGAPFGEGDFRHLAIGEVVRAGVDVMRVALEYPLAEERVTLEYSQPRDLRAKIDAVVLDANGKPEVAIELSIIAAMSAAAICRARCSQASLSPSSQS